MIGVYDYTVILTYLSTISGVVGIIVTMTGMGHPYCGTLFLMLSGLLDGFDGKVARTKKDRTEMEKEFGIQIDSLSDLICFGVLPAVLVYKLSAYSFISLYISGLYVLAALIRLAWFNVDEAERQLTEAGHRELYLGLPVTSSALVLPILSELAYPLGFSMSKAGPVALMIMAIAFLCPFKLKKPAIIGKSVMVVTGGMAMVFLVMGFDI